MERLAHPLGTKGERGRPQLRRLLRHQPLRYQRPQPQPRPRLLALVKGVSEPDSITVNGRLEYYRSNHLWSYGLTATLMQAPGSSDTVAAHTFKYAYVYQDRNNVYLAWSTGNEIDFDPSTLQLVSNQLDSLTLGGMHWLYTDLALVYTVSNHRVGSTGFGYQRNELYLGLRKPY